MPPLPETQVAAFLRQGFLGIPDGMSTEAELAAMNRSYDSLFHGHMDGRATGHQGLVQAPISSAPVPWAFGPQLWSNVRAAALQLLGAARREAGLDDGGVDFGKSDKCGAIVKPAVTGLRTELHQDEGYYDQAFDWSLARIMVWIPIVDVGVAGGCMQ